MGKHRESPEIGQMIDRMFRSLVRRAGEGDLEALETLAHLERSAADAVRAAGEATARSGYSYTQIGDALYISRQAARQRFGKTVQ